MLRKPKAAVVSKMGSLCPLEKDHSSMPQTAEGNCLALSQTQVIQGNFNTQSKCVSWIKKAKICILCDAWQMSVLPLDSWFGNWSKRPRNSMSPELSGMFISICLEHISQCFSDQSPLQILFPSCAFFSYPLASWCHAMVKNLKKCWFSPRNWTKKERTSILL